MAIDQSNSSPPRIGITHLLTLTMGVAIALGIQVRTIDLWRDAFSQNALQTTQLMFAICSSLVSGLALAGLFWLFDWRRRKGPFQLQPGHWLIIGWGLSFLMLSLMQLFAFGILRNEWLEQNARFGWFVLVPSLMQSSLSLLVFGYALFRTAGIWRTVFAALILQTLGDALLTVMLISGTGVTFIQRVHYLSVALQFMPIVCVLLALFWDLIAKRSRDWIHYCGVFLPLGMFLLEVASGIYFRFFSAS